MPFNRTSQADYRVLSLDRNRRGLCVIRAPTTCGIRLVLNTSLKQNVRKRPILPVEVGIPGLLAEK